MTRKIYHCNLFFNELDLLKLKLETENDYVDYFVISESNITHSGISKELFFENNKNKFTKFLDKIIHQKLTNDPIEYNDIFDKNNSRDYLYSLVVDKIKNHTHYDKSNFAYFRDSWEKESLIRPLGACQDSDIIILSDLDEIIKPDVIAKLKENFDDDKIYYFNSDVYYYYLNLRKDEYWDAPLAMNFKKFKELSFCECRNFKRIDSVFIQNAGWHFSYQGGIDAIKKKIESFGEQSLNLNWVKQGLESSITNVLQTNRDLYNRNAKFWIENISYETHPSYLVEHKNEFSHMIKPLTDCVFCDTIEGIKGGR